MEIAKGGRPVKVLNETEITKLEALACCLTKSQAAEYFGMTAKTLRAIDVLNILLAPKLVHINE